MVVLFKYNNKKRRISKRRYCRTPDLRKCPHKKAMCLVIFRMAPKKPNSAKRSVAKVQLTSTKKKTRAYIPGIGHTLHKFSIVLIRGGRANDLPGVKYRAIRGKLELPCVYGRMQSRSKYGTKKTN